MNLSDRTINALQGQQFSMQQPQHAALAYVVNWASVLQSGTIATSSWKGDCTIAGEASTDATATARLSGEPGKYRVVNKITTAGGDTDERIIMLAITDNGSHRVGDYE